MDTDLIKICIETLKNEDFNSWEDISETDKDLWIGVMVGWWEWVDIKRKMPIPFPKIVNVWGKPKHFTMAHALHEVGFFDSVTLARKEGWNKPIVLGEHFLFKRTKRLLICSVDTSKILGE